MSIGREEAMAALADIEANQALSARLHGYERLAPYLAVTGAFWLCADLTLRFSRTAGGWAWPLAALLIVPAFAAIALVQRRRQSPADQKRWRRGAALCALIVGYLTATYMLVRPTGHEIHGLAGLMTGFGFAAVGVWVGARLLMTGLMVILLTLASGMFFGPGDNILFMGLVGGGGMLLGAWWLSRV